MRATSSTSFTLNKTLQTTRAHLSSDYGALPALRLLFGLVWFGLGNKPGRDHNLG